MKNHLLLSLLLLASHYAGAQTPALSPEETAVKAVIERETEMFAAGNLEKWATTRTHTENNLTISQGPGGTSITRGWKQELAGAAWVKDFPGGIKISVERTNWNIRVSGNVAWATYDQTISVPQLGMKDQRTAQIRCLEKTGGQWTITVLTYTEIAPPADTTEIQEAIKKVLREETQAYMDADLAKWTSLHTHDPNETVVWTEDNFAFGGFDSWAAMAVWAIDDFSKRGKSTDKLSCENYKFTIRGNMAFVIYDQTVTAADGKTSVSREHRVLVRQDGGWKIQACLIYFNPAAEKK